MRTVDYLDAIKRRHKLTSDYQVHKLLGVSKQTITHYRHGRSGFSDEIAARVAHLLTLDPLKVLADVHSERATSDEARALWRMIAARAAQAAALLLVLGVVSLSALPTSAEARSVKDLRAEAESSRNIHYTRFRRRAPRYGRRACATIWRRSRTLRLKSRALLARSGFLFRRLKGQV